VERVESVPPIGWVTRLICTCLLYLASVVGATVFYRTVQGQPVQGIGSFLVLFAGPLIAVAVFRRPPTVLVPIVLFVPYYVVVALSIANEYDESRWSYSRMEAGAFYLAVQLLAAWAAFTVYRETAASRHPLQ
jgi:hypothetical protein